MLRISEDDARVLAGEEPATSSRRARGRNPESDYQHAIIAALEHARCLVVRLNVGGIRTERGGYVRMAPAGMPDLLVIPPTGGIWLFEVKSPRGRVSADQLAMHALLRARGVNVAVVRSVDEALAYIDIHVSE